MPLQPCASQRPKSTAQSRSIRDYPRHPLLDKHGLETNVTAAHTDSVIPTFVLKEVRDEPDVYAFQSETSVDLGERA
jgi:hypothetical protein